MFFSACAQNVFTHYSDVHFSEETGTLLIQLSDAMSGVSVTIDGFLVVEKKSTQRIQVNGVKAGKREVTIIGGGGSREPLDKTETVEITPGETTTMLVSVAPHTMGYQVQSGLLLVAWYLYWALR